MEQINRELLKGIQEGDQRAFGMLIRLYFQPLTQYSKNIISDFEQAKDIVQEVFLKIWKSHDDFEISVSLKSFLYKAVHNASIDYLRKLKTQKMLHAISYDDIQFRLQVFEIREEEHFFDILFSEEFEVNLQKAIEQLPPQCKEIFILNRYEHLSYNEISQKLSLSISTIKTQMMRAMHKLQESMKTILQ